VNTYNFTTVSLLATRAILWILPGCVAGHLADVFYALGPFLL